MADPHIKPALSAFLEEQFGGNYDVKVATLNVGLTVTPIVQNDFERLALTFVNAGANDIFILPNSQPAVGSGILLGATGGFLSLIARDDLVLVGWNWNGIAKTAATNLLVFEVFRYTNE